ncbi:hypothetical protein AB4305_24930 [Nocardia sp. 2YAB30]|uniref:hypothetical protein n=1 Tax=Nocardia sp. 2YAB30 TaxID=3233022 RepID=UPI003F9D23D9
MASPTRSSRRSAIVCLFGAFTPATAISCRGGIIAVGVVGTVAGQAPVPIGAAIQYFATISQPPMSPAK